MSELARRLLSGATVAVLATSSLLFAPNALAAPRPDPGSEEAAAPGAAGKGDSDGDKIADDLEAALADLKPGDRVDVIVQGASPSGAKEAAPSLEVDQEYSIIKGFSGSITAGQVNALSRNPWVTRVELDGVTVAFDAAGDRDYGVQAARDAGIATDGGLDGSGVGICIIDTGIDPNHEQLSGRVVGWKDWVGNQSTPYDDHGHGTHVASIAAGDASGSADATVYGGVARAASLIGAKVLDSSGSGSDADVTAAIQWCAARADVDVISMSLGSPGGDGADAGSQAANAAVAGGKVVVVAAGNDGDGPGTVASPGVATDVITVGAATDYSVPAGQPGHDPGLVLAGFSSRGPTDNPAAPLKPDIIAPGVSVVAAKAGTTASYVAYSGTSMATPFAAGVAALGLEAEPGATPGQVKAALQSSATDVGSTGADNDWGHGLVDARAFLDELGGVAPVTRAPAPDHLLVQGTVPDGGTAELPIEVGTAGKPLGLSVRVDGQPKCSLGFGNFCLVYEWSPDLDLQLVNPAGQVVAGSQCPLDATNGNCGGMGQWETVGVASAEAGTWTLRVIPFADSPNNGQGGSFDADVFGALTSTPPLTLSKPANVAGTAGPGINEVSVSWDPVVTDGVPPVTGYEVEKSPSTGSPVWTPAGSVTDPGTSLVVSGLAKGSSWVFQVRAVNVDGPGPWSDPSVAVAIPVTVPGAPVGPLVGVPGPGTVELSWTAPLSDGGSPITGYQVWYRVSASDPWTLITWDTGSEIPNYTVAGLTPGTGYQFAIRANNTIGASDYITSGPGIQPLAGPVTVPGAPVGPLVGVPGPGTVELSWTAPLSDGGSPITGYQVWYRVSASDPWTLITWDTGSEIPNYTVAGLTPGTGYQFAIRANNTIGASDYITSGPGIQPLAGPVTVPGAPVGPLVGVPGPGTVELSWTAPLSDGGSPITGYQVWYRVSASDPWTLITWDTGSEIPNYTVAGLTPGTGYQFAIRANNTIGESDYITSGPGIQPLAGPVTVPGAPVGPLVGVPGPQSVALSWTTGADGGSPITGYQVWKRVASGDPWSVVTWDTASDLPEYTVAELTAGTGYQFAIRANNAVGESDYITSDPDIIPL